MNETPEGSLLNLASSIAIYNDKGWLWGRHSMQEILKQQNEFKNSLKILIDEIGRSRLSSAALKIVENEEFITDDTGRFHVELLKLISDGNLYVAKA